MGATKVLVPTAEVNVNHAISVGGTPGAPLPVIQIANHFLRLENAAARVHDLRIDVVEPATATRRLKLVRHLHRAPAR